jgi:ribulose-5-phosphate 4-epimerase/fuculose-1-phosphate aldolase
MQMKELLQQLCDAAASFYARGYAFGSTGNLSIRCGEQIWISPTGASLRALTPDALACLDAGGGRLNANSPSKEYPFHLAAYRAAGARASAIVHLHSTHAVALSCLDSLDPAEPLPVFTPYYLMRVAPLAIVDYFPPGSAELAAAIGQAAAAHDCLLLRNHGLVCLGRTMPEAVDRAEELEETARLYFLLRGEKVRFLTSSERAEITSRGLIRAADRRPEPAAAKAQAEMPRPRLGLWRLLRNQARSLVLLIRPFTMHKQNASGMSRIA